jgi:hypothetical protein
MDRRGWLVLGAVIVGWSLLYAGLILATRAMWPR